MEAHASPAGRSGTRQRHPEGTGEHPLTDRGQLFLAGLAAASWIADSFVFRFSACLSRQVPAAVRWPVGAAVMIVAAVLALRAHRAVFEDATRSTLLITEGAYAIVRHPLYLGSWLFFVGLTLTTLSLASAAVNVVMLAFSLWVSRFEEKLLLEAFGPAYREYQARTPRGAYPGKPSSAGRHLMARSPCGYCSFTMTWIPAFEAGLGNGWLFMIVYPLQWLAVLVLPKRIVERTRHPPEIVKTREDRIVAFLTQGLWIGATLLSVFVPLCIGTPWFWVGLASFLAGRVVLVLASVAVARTADNVPFTSGIYRFSRHPMYLSMLLVYLGVSIAAVSWLFVLVTAATFFLQRCQMLREEAHCIARFGRRYRDYMAVTARWFGLPARSRNVA